MIPGNVRYYHPCNEGLRPTIAPDIFSFGGRIGTSRPDETVKVRKFDEQPAY